MSVILVTQTLRTSSPLTFFLPVLLCCLDCLGYEGGVKNGVVVKVLADVLRCDLALPRSTTYLRMSWIALRLHPD